MKKCTACNQIKEFAFFSKNARLKDGHAQHCKVCESEKKKLYRDANKEKIAKQKAESYQKHKEKHLKKCAEWQRNNKDKKNAINARYRNSHKEQIAAHLKIYNEANKEKIAERTSAWAKKDLGSRSATRRKNQASDINRVPNWLTEADFLHMKCIYQVAAMRTRESGQEWHVDHIIPLRGELVSGLHVPYNLQVIPATENWSKNRSYTIS